MSSSATQNGNNAERLHVRRNTEQDGAEQSPGSARRFHALFSHILVGPGEENLDDLTCVHAVYLLFLLSFVSVTSSLYCSVIRRNIERELNGCINAGEIVVDLVPRCRDDEMVSAESITLRLGFSLTVTLFSLSLLTLKSPQDGPRARIHQGFWLLKFFCISFLSTASLFIPLGGFDLVWTAISFEGAFLFQVFQTVLILDLATSASDGFVTRITVERSRLWYLAWLVGVWFVYFAAFVLTAVLCTMFVDGCGANVVLVTGVVIFCALVALVTVQFGDQRTGLLHSGLVALYVLFLTLVTLERGSVCRKGKTTNDPGEELARVKVFDFFQIILGFLSVAYAGLRSWNTRHFCYGNSVIAARQSNDEAGATETLEQEGENSKSRETTDNPRISPSLFYFLLGTFSLFMTSTLTASRTSENAEPAINDTTAFYLRSLTILLIAIMVIWSQIHPVLFPSENAFDFFALHRTFFRFVLGKARRLLIDGCACCNGPTTSRYIFTLLFLLGLSFACLLYVPVVRRSLSANPYFCATAGSLGNCLSTDPAYMAVYRVCFAMATFYLLFAAILVCVENARDPRVDLQYKAWPVKFALFFSLLLCSFFLPKEFSRVWIYATLVGTFLFTVLQLALLIHWTKHASKKLEEKVEETGSSFWPAFVSIATMLLFLLCLVAVVIFYVFFTGLTLCLTNRIFISLNVVLAMVASVSSVHPKVYDAGLFQCSIIVVFSVYLTWSGLSHNPEERCNPVAGYVAEEDMRPNLNIQAVVDLFFTVVTVVYFSAKVPALTASLRELGEKFRQRQQLSTQTHASMESQLSTDDTDCPVYNFTLFHFVYFLASLHATMILTNWYIPSQGSRFKLSVNWAAMCVKMTAGSLSLVIYVWSIVTQLITT